MKITTDIWPPEAERMANLMLRDWLLGVPKRPDITGVVKFFVALSEKVRL